MSTRVPLRRLPFSLPIGSQLSRAVRAVAFWAAIAAPIGYPFLVIAGESGTRGGLFFGLLALNVCALAVGHGHEPGSTQPLSGSPATEHANDVSQPSD